MKFEFKKNKSFLSLEKVNNLNVLLTFDIKHYYQTLTQFKINIEVDLKNCTFST